MNPQINHTFNFFLRFYDSLWDSWFRPDEDDFLSNKLIKKRRKSSGGDRRSQNIPLNSTNGYFLKTPWLQDGVSRDQLDQTDKSVDKFLQAVINDRHGY